MKVAAIQHDIRWEDAEATRAHLESLITQAAAQRPDLIVLSEMYATGFSMQTDRIAEPEGGPNEQFLVDRARHTGAWLIASIAQHDPRSGKARNNAIVASPSGEVQRYSKIHPFSYGREHEHYAAGTEFLTVDIAQTRTSVFICYDLRFSDEFWALANDTDLYVVVANWPEPRREHWRTLLRARAIENQAYVVGVNRVGRAPQLNYTGDSAIIDPLGNALAEASQTETILTAEVDARQVKEIRDRFGFLSDRRHPTR